jgi:hypothetical protein
MAKFTSQSIAQSDVSYKVNIATETGNLVLDNADIIEFVFIEDIFSFCMTAKLTFVDKVGTMELAPLTGNEHVAITYGSKDTYVVVFQIFSISDITGLSQVEEGSQQVIEMTLIEPRYFALTQNVFSKSWVNSRISDVVKDINQNMLANEPFVNFEKSNESLPYFYMPYWTPMEAIKWISDKASGNVSGQPGYLFYSNSLGLNYQTLENMFTTIDNIEIDEKTNQPATYIFNTSRGVASMDAGLIIGWSMSNIDKQSLIVLRGGHRLGFDSHTKTFIDRSFKYSTAISKYTLFGRKTLFPDMSLSNAKYELTGESEVSHIDNQYYSDFIRRYTKQLTFIITVRGHERRHAGQLTQVKWPSGDQRGFFNKNLEGKYMIKSITHSFGPHAPVYKQKIVLIKTAYDQCDDRTLYPAAKYNLKLGNFRLGKV